MTQISVDTKIRINTAGIIGALLFVLSPAVAGFLYLGSFGSPGVLASQYGGIMVLAGIFTSLGFVMILLGRSYHHHVQILKPGEVPRP